MTVCVAIISNSREVTEVLGGSFVLSIGCTGVIDSDSFLIEEIAIIVGAMASTIESMVEDALVA